MSRIAKIAGVAALAGIMVTVATVTVSRPQRPAAAPAIDRASDDKQLEADLRRCRTVTIPDSGCEAAWEAKRRRFFGRDDTP